MVVERRVKIGYTCGVPRHINHVRNERMLSGPFPEAPDVTERRILIVGLDGDCTRNVPGDARFQSGYWGDTEQVLVFDTHNFGGQPELRRNRPEESRIKDRIVEDQKKAQKN